MQLNREFAGLPHIDQYVGVWGLWEPQFKALVNHAQQLNLQLHLANASAPEASAEIEARRETEYEVTRDGVAIIPLHGTLMKHASSFSANTSTVAARRKIRAAAKDEEVAAVLLHVDSPGGTIAGTHDLAADIRGAAAQKPVYGYAEDLCASAGYWFLSQCTKCFAGDGAVVGSIGVFSVVADFSKAAEDQKIKVHVIRFGQFKGAGVPGTEVTEQQLAEYQKLVDSFGEDFLQAVMSGRNLTRPQAEQLADGRVHKGQAAVDLRLIDGVQTLDATIEQLVLAARQPLSTKGPKTMSTETTTVAAATLDELKANCPGASSDFLLAQLEGGATVPAAMKAFNAALAKERDEAAARATTAEEKQAEAEKKAAGCTAGNEPLNDLGEGGDADAEFDGDPQAAWNQAVTEAAEKRFNGNRMRASAHVRRTQPDLYNALMQAAEQQSAQRASERTSRRRAG